MTRQNQSYKTMSDELDAILSALQAQDLDVDEALKLYDRGQKIITELESYLQNAENKIRQLAGEEE